jgi:hypothetical protein
MRPFGGGTGGPAVCTTGGWYDRQLADGDQAGLACGPLNSRKTCSASPHPLFVTQAADDRGSQGRLILVCVAGSFCHSCPLRSHPGPARGRDKGRGAAAAAQRLPGWAGSTAAAGTRPVWRRRTSGRQSSGGAAL